MDALPNSTTTAMTAGMAHVAAGVGAGAEFRGPMAFVIGGLATSTLLSLAVLPVVIPCSTT